MVTDNGAVPDVCNTVDITISNVMPQPANSKNLILGKYHPDEQVRNKVGG